MIVIVAPYFTMRLKEGNEIGMGLLRFICGPAAERTSAGLVRRWFPFVKKDVEGKVIFLEDGSEGVRR